MGFWEGKKVLVTGGTGFIGSHLVELIVRLGACVRVVDNLENGDVKNLESVKSDIDVQVDDLCDYNVCRKAARGREVIFNLAAKVGGVGFNVAHPGTMYTSNVLINTQMLEAAREAEVERYLCVSSACVYPRYCSIPTPESEGFNGVPEPTNLGYGWAKRMAEVQAQAYAKEFGMKISIVRPYNTYGPRDHFDLEVAHVIPALIKKVFDGMDPLQVWGDGEQSRSFLYVTDLARGLVEAIEKYPVPDPLNLGTDEEIKIKDLVDLVLGLSERNPRVFFDSRRPGGQPRRNCDNRKAREKIGFTASVGLKEGVRKTIEWYKNELGE